jgi:hypothetical protein
MGAVSNTEYRCFVLRDFSSAVTNCRPLDRLELLAVRIAIALRIITHRSIQEHKP